MKRNVIAAIAGIATWFAVAFIAGLIVRATWPAYVRVADDPLMYTLAMKIMRLSVGVVATIAMGFVSARITQSRVASLAPGVILLIVFIPEHVMLWDKFPIWYHLWFLLTFVPLTWAGNAMARRAPSSRGALAYGFPPTRE